MNKEKTFYSHCIPRNSSLIVSSHPLGLEKHPPSPCSLVSCVLGVYQGRGLGSYLCIFTRLTSPFFAFNQWPQVTWAFPSVGGGGVEHKNSSMRFWDEQVLLSASGPGVWQATSEAMFSFYSLFFGTTLSAVILRKLMHELLWAWGLPGCRKVVEWGRASPPGSIPWLVTADKWQQQPQLKVGLVSWPFPWTRISILHHVFVSFEMLKCRLEGTRLH